MKKLVRESITRSEPAAFLIKDLCDGTVTWENIAPYVLKYEVLPDPGFYSDITVRNAKDLENYLKQFKERFGSEGKLTFNRWGFSDIKDNKKYSVERNLTADAVDYGKGRYMGD